jgi:hypothetical protein
MKQLFSWVHNETKVKQYIGHSKQMEKTHAKLDPINSKLDANNYFFNGLIYPKGKNINNHVYIMKMKE